MEFEDGITATFDMTAFSQHISSRETTIYLTNGEIRIDMNRNSVYTYNFLRDDITPRQPLVAGPKTRAAEVHCAESGAKQPAPVPAEKTERTRMMGHGGADYFLMDAFVRAVARNDPSLIVADIADALQSHLLVFAAENARRSASVVTP